MTTSSSNTWVFIVGNCAEWETRDVSGDKQLYKVSGLFTLCIIDITYRIQKYDNNFTIRYLDT